MALSRLAFLLRGRRDRLLDVPRSQGADEHIDRLAKKYLGVEKYPYRQPGEVRIIFKLQPERIRTYG